MNDIEGYENKMDQIDGKRPRRTFNTTGFLNVIANPIKNVPEKTKIYRSSEPKRLKKKDKALAQARRNEMKNKLRRRRKQTYK